MNRKIVWVVALVTSTFACRAFREERGGEERERKAGATDNAPERAPQPLDERSTEAPTKRTATGTG